MKLTIGMATHADFFGVWPTVQSVRLYHPEVLDDLEVLVVDNDPGGTHAEPTRALCAHAGVRYIPFDGVKGTSAPRDLVFREAAGDAVVCIDPHVMLAPGSLKRLIDFYDANPGTMDLYQGPMLYDSLDYVTHFTNVWGAEMWGQWATAWECACKRFQFDVSGGDQQDGRGHQCLYRSIMATGATDFVTECPQCGKALPAIPYVQHEPQLRAAGYRRMAWVSGDEAPFEIPAMGLGLFSCRKEAWLGFNPSFRGFGGEEWYIHLKYKQAGHTTYCLPFLKWLHRFGRPGGVSYPLTVWNKVRNYVIGHRELGMDPGYIKQHFSKLSDAHWQAILAGAETEPTAPAEPTCGSCQTTATRPQPPAGASIDELFAWVKSQPRDLDQHADKIRQLAADADRIVAFVKRREWNVILAAGKPDNLTVHQVESDPLLDLLAKELATEDMGYVSVPADANASLTTEPVDCDLLVLDTVMHADRLMAELERHGVRADRILVRGSGAFAEQAEGVQGPGLLPAIRRFVKEHPEYTVIEHVPHQYGWSLLSRRAEDKKPLPSWWEQGVKALKASWRAGQNVVGNYGPLKDTPVQQARLSLCLICDQHTDGKCAQCGCPVDNKTSFGTEACPLGKWGQEAQPEAEKAA